MILKEVAETDPNGGAVRLTCAALLIPLPQSDLRWQFTGRCVQLYRLKLSALYQHWLVLMLCHGSHNANQKIFA